VFANDFGDIYDVVKGQGNWDEANYWFEKIADYCRSHGLIQLFVAVPFEEQLLGKRKPGFYPGKLTNALNLNGTQFLNPAEDFINAHLEIFNDGVRSGQRPYGCPLFNAEIHDGHFSPLGSQVWAESVSRRLVLLLERDRLLRPKKADVSHNGPGRTWPRPEPNPGGEALP
jgi:hypothetical protein